MKDSNSDRSDLRRKRPVQILLPGEAALRKQLRAIRRELRNVRAPMLGSTCRR